MSSGNTETAANTATPIIPNLYASVPMVTGDSFRRLAKSMSPSDWMLEAGLYTDLDSLLKATARQKPRSRIGTHSLFATCLRKVPQYMAAEQQWADAEDEGSAKDVTTAIYNDLESFGSCLDGGWKPLRVIIRAHGIAILGDAIRDGAIRQVLARGLVMLCLQVSAFDEAEYLCDSLLDTLRPVAKPTIQSGSLFTGRTSISLQTLQDVSSHSNQWGFFYTRLSSLFETGVLPIEWISTQGMIMCWNRVIESITQQTGFAQEAETLLRTVIALSYHCTLAQLEDRAHSFRLRTIGLTDPRLSSQVVPYEPRHNDRLACKDQKTTLFDKAVTNTISDLVTVLLSVAVVLPEINASNTEVNLGSTPGILLALATDSCRHELVAYTSDDCEACTVSAPRACLPLLANELLMTSRYEEPGFGELCRSMASSNAKTAQKTRFADELMLFVCSVAHCSEQVGTRSSLHYMQWMLQSLLDRASGPLCTSPALCGMQGFALGAAFTFAEHTNKREHFDWALELEETINLDSVEASVRKQATKKEPVPDKRSKGFRWEEGICEWVAKTPAMALKKPIIGSLLNGSSLDEPTQLDTQGSQTLPMTPSLSQAKRCPGASKSSLLQHPMPSAASPSSTRRFVCVRIDDHRCTERGSHNKGGSRISTVKRKDCDRGTSLHAASAQSTALSSSDSENHAEELHIFRCLSAGQRSQRPKLRDVTNRCSGLARPPSFPMRQRARRQPPLSLKRSKRQKKWHGPGCMGSEIFSEDELAV
ncbi:hypothetical protein MMC13_003576 [Lambiella insularis]|nr:hypothetical protein [Lambiella insularis]